MSNLILNALEYTQLNTEAWYATAIVNEEASVNNFLILSVTDAAYLKRQRQRQGVRLLLQTLLSKLDIIDKLDESQYPYRLMNSGYYVCFSHSDGADLIDKVAVALSHHRPIGIDIETQAVKWHVAERFYHATEMTRLVQLPFEQQMIVARYLWQIKESFIKIHQYTLAQGLGMDYTHIIPMLINTLNNHDDFHPAIIINDYQANYRIGVSMKQQTVIVF